MFKAIFDIIFSVIDLIGVKKTYKLISKFKAEYLYNASLKDFVMNSICNKYKISKEEFIRGRSRKNRTRFIARSIYIYIIFEICSPEKVSIASDLECSINSLTDNLQFIKNLDEKIKYENEIILYVQELKEKINKDFINT